MPEQPRVFVGTMFTQEGDFQKAAAQIQAQEGVIVRHFIVADLKEKEAHNALWHAWKEARDDQDLFVKIDADTVLASPQTLAQICALFAADPRVTGLQAPLHDYMTNSLINGLNAFSPKVIFNDTQDELYCDRAVDTGHNVVLRERDLPAELIPAGYHCHHANEMQGFHYGVHRMMKGQKSIIHQVTVSWDRDRDRIRGFALIGALMAGRFFKDRRFNYSDVEFIAAFEEAVKNYDDFTTDIAAGRFDRVH